jgi:hypothetical protein
MRLTEFETKNLLEKYGFLNPHSLKRKRIMAYKNFTFNLIEEKLGIRRVRQQLFGKTVEMIKPSAWLQQTLAISGESMTLTTEKAISETIVAPILQEIKLRNKQKIQLFSGENLEADKEKGLNGECDFIFAKSQAVLEITNPIIQVTEAKRGDISNPRSLSQTAAQMIGARVFNKLHKKEKEEKIIETIYGACTTGYEWIFLKLEAETIFIDTDRYVLNNLSELLGVLQKIVDFYD